MKLRIWFFNFLIGLTAAATLFGAIASVYYQSGFLVVTSRSMEPSIKAGDMLLVRPIRTFEVQRDDVLVLPVPDVPELRYTHRVISVSPELNGVEIKTQGDANPSPDAWRINVTDEKVPKVVAVLPTRFFFALTHIFGNDT